MPQNDAQAPESTSGWHRDGDSCHCGGTHDLEPGILARLTSTITVEESAHGIELWSSGRMDEKCIILKPQAEDKLLELLLALRDARLAP